MGPLCALARNVTVRVMMAVTVACVLIWWAHGATATGPRLTASPLPDASASPPGANNWKCRPTRSHPRPVVLVHGLFSTGEGAWRTLSPLLTARGYCVYSLTYGLVPGDSYAGGLAPMEQSSAELGRFVDRVLAATGACQVDMVGHSEGTLMPQYYLKFGHGAGKVVRFVALAPLYHGTTTWGVDPLIADARVVPQVAAALDGINEKTCAACAEFAQGSPFLQHLYADGVYAIPGVRYTSIMTRYDELVTPYTSGVIDAPGAVNITLQDQCPLDLTDHVGMIADPIALQDVLNALDPAHAVPPPCKPVLPAIGVITG